MRWRFAFSLAALAVIGGMLLYARHRRLEMGRERVRARLRMEAQRRDVWRLQAKLYEEIGPARLRGKLVEGGRIPPPDAAAPRVTASR